MKNAILLTIVAVTVASGQFINLDSLDTVPYMRHRLNSARYEIQPSISEEIAYQAPETARTSNQGRRHIDNVHRGNVQHGPHVHENEYENKPFISQHLEPNLAQRQPDINREHHINSDVHYRQTQQQNHDIILGESSIRQVNKNTQEYNRDQNRANGENYDANLKTNRQNTHLHDHTPNQGRVATQRSYANNDNVRINQNSANQYDVKQDTSYTEASIQKFEKGSFKPNSNEGNLAKNHNVNIGEYPQPDHRHHESRLSNENTDVTNQKVNNEIRQSVNTRSINGTNYRDNINHHHTDTRHEVNYGNRQSTEPSRRVTSGDRLYTSGTKSTQDNELSSKPYKDRHETKDDKWAWMDVPETSTKITNSTLPAVDDRAAFDGGKCPTGKVKINEICVDKD